MYFFLSIISQGNSWTQIHSLKIQSNIFNYLKNNIHIFEDYGNIVFDRSDFASNIKHSFLNREYNNLRTYYGAQCIEDWGLSSMVRYINNENKNNFQFFVANKILPNDKDVNSDFFQIEISEGNFYREVRSKEMYLSKNNTKIIKFDDIFYPKFLKN
tara:strand:+ start:58 stop:528 length:471 start_codon:yes stop_codon:yes gene_type:complete